MKRWLPSPLVSGIVLLLWLLLQQSADAANLLLGLMLALGVPLLTRPFFHPIGFPRLSKPVQLLKLLALAGIEIVRSCFNVSRIILFARPEGLNSRFIRIPLDLKNPYGLALLSCLINMTPGTVWVEILPEKYELALHVFDLHDEQWWVDTIKSHYERPLIEIFE
ncbi:Na+/H+ antiporter subunit E [Noviherbaspirillum denitrificans]|uniref:Pesticidal protein Cry1Ia n=1 Tax=Noviherbaspirillum denitrificans TaxID=1968433 RepID=A0A254TEK6_9BURK|nr:Na+/H+ antiporter subunit E [Noviherbaspirillum denitrificans]OWW18098.1 pesticidal protein Cry1Ia [Noviherbaspirillum denitrificans]